VVNHKSALLNDVQTLKEEAAAALAAVGACAKVTVSDGVLLDKDLRQAKAGKAQFALVSSLETTDAKHRATLRTNETRTLHAIEKQATRAAADATKLKKQPGNTVVQTDLAAALAALQSAADANTVSIDATRCHLGVSGSLQPIAAAFLQNAKIQTDIAAASSESDNIGQILQAPMQTVLAIVADVKNDATAT
jgi:hypothetical protein